MEEGKSIGYIFHRNLNTTLYIFGFTIIQILLILLILLLFIVVSIINPKIGLIGIASLLYGVIQLSSKLSKEIEKGNPDAASSLLTRMDLPTGFYDKKGIFKTIRKKW